MAYTSIIFLLLLITLPDSEYPVLPMPDNKPLLVYYDSLWPGPDKSYGTFENTAALMPGLEFKPVNYDLHLMQKTFFSEASIVNKNPLLLKNYVRLFADIRNKSKIHSLSYIDAQRTSYLLIEGGRTLIEEIIINNKTTVSPECFGTSAPSAAPSGNLAGITVHSGDLLLSKGLEPVSGIFTRILDFPSVYSHVAMVYVDEQTDSVFVIEAHAFQGTVVRKSDEYLNYTKKRLMVLRLRSDLPEIKKDPLIPHKAAVYAVKDALSRNAPYDYKMDHKDSSSQYCSEIPYFAYKSQGILLWEPVPKLMSAGNTKLSAAFGVPSPELLIPAYLEYDPRLIVTAEWFNEKLLYEDHLENVVLDAMMRREPERNKDYSFFQLPYARLVKAYSSIADFFGYETFIPPGMTAASAIRLHIFRQNFLDILKLTREKAEKYIAINNTMPGIRMLARFAEDSIKDYNY